MPSASMRVLAALALLCLRATASRADGCDLRRDPCNGVYLINDEPGIERFYFHEATPTVTPWVQASNVAHCGKVACSMQLSSSVQASNTMTTSEGETFTVGESHSTTTSSQFSKALKVGMSVRSGFKPFGIGVDVTVSADGTFTWSDSTAETHGTSTSTARSATYAVATGRTLGRTESMTCIGKAGDKMYLASRKKYIDFRGNFCRFSYRDDEGAGEAWGCKYVSGRVYAVLPGSEQLDIDLQCVEERDNEVQVGCHSIQGPGFEAYCQTNGRAGHCPPSHCEQ